MYKIIENVYKIRFRRDHFETCNKWVKRKGLSVVIKILSQMDCLPRPGGYIHMVKHEKKSDFKAFFFKNLQQMGKVIRAFCPQGVVCPCAGAIYIYKIIKNVYKIRFLFLNLQRISKVIRAFC